MAIQRSGLLMLGIGTLFGIGVACLAAWLFWGIPLGSKIPLVTPYQAVLLTGGEGYYGKLEGLGSAYPILTDVYYVKRQTEPQEQKAQFVLVKRGKEWHRPDRMILNANHILFIEPVDPNSDVAKAIAESKKQ